MKTQSEVWMALIFFALTAMIVQFEIGCADQVAFTAVPRGTASAPSSGPSSGGCQIQNLTRPVKIMFAVDTSGSNVSSTMDEGTIACLSPFQNCFPATDPQKVFRGGSISNFFSALQGKTNFSWGFETFSGTSAQSYIPAGGQAPGFGDATAMQAAINQFADETDADATPYLAALNNIQTAVAQDPDLNSEGVATPLYLIVFMSDGFPTDALSSENPVTVNMSAIQNAISGISALAPGRVTLSTIYYGTINDPTAASTLQSMATAGNGQFVNVDTSSTSSITIDDVISVPVGQCNEQGE